MKLKCNKMTMFPLKHCIFIEQNNKHVIVELVFIYGNCNLVACGIFPQVLFSYFADAVITPNREDTGP